MEYEVLNDRNRRLPNAIFKRIDAAKRFRNKWLREHRHIARYSIVIYKTYKDKLTGLWYGETI